LGLFGCLYGLLARLGQTYFVRITWLAGNTQIGCSSRARFRRALPSTPVASRAVPLRVRSRARARCSSRPRLRPPDLDLDALTAPGPAPAALPASPLAPSRWPARERKVGRLSFYVTRRSFLGEWRSCVVEVLSVLSGRREKQEILTTFSPPPPMAVSTFSSDETTPFFGFLGATAVLVFSSEHSLDHPPSPAGFHPSIPHSPHPLALMMPRHGHRLWDNQEWHRRTSMGVMRPKLVMKSIIPVGRRHGWSPWHLRPYHCHRRGVEVLPCPSPVRQKSSKR